MWAATYKSSIQRLDNVSWWVFLFAWQETGQSTMTRMWWIWKGVGTKGVVQWEPLLEQPHSWAIVSTSPSNGNLKIFRKNWFKFSLKDEGWRDKGTMKRCHRLLVAQATKCGTAYCERSLDAISLDAPALPPRTRFWVFRRRFTTTKTNFIDRVIQKLSVH